MREKRKLARLLFASILLSGSSVMMAQTNKPVTVQLKQASIRKLFVEIKKQVQVNFMYSNNAVEGLEKKDYNFTNASLEKILRHCLAGSGLTFEIADDNRTVVIKRKPQDENRATGKVVDGQGEPLIGVSVREPLWVVDGIVVNDPVEISPEELNDPDFVNRIGNAIAGLNPQDIERLDVLKDASATALYGSKAANGVIVIPPMMPMATTIITRRW